MNTTQLSLDGIEELKLLDESGNEPAISSLWRERRADEFETAGLRLAVIGNGDPSHIPGFRKATGFFGEVYTDSDKTVYDALSFRRGMGSMVGLKSVKSLVGSILSGHFSPDVQSDALQQDGVLGRGLMSQVRRMAQTMIMTTLSKSYGRGTVAWMRRPFSHPAG